MADRIGEVIEQSSAINKIKLLIRRSFHRPPRLFEQMMNGALDIMELRRPVVSGLQVVHDRARESQRFLVEVQEGELRAEILRGQKALNLLRRTATKGHDARLSALAGSANRNLDELLDEIVNSIAVSLNRRLREEPKIHQLGKQGTAFVRAAQHHVDHLVVAGIAQRFDVATIEKRSAKQQGMKLALGKDPVRRDQIRFHILRGFFKSIKERSE